MKSEDVFEWHKNDIEEHLEDAEYQASECNVEGMLKDFYIAIYQLKGLQSVFEPEPQDVREYVENKIYYGIKTGLNEAFVIDQKTKKQLISEDPKSVEIIKPFLVGRDIKRYESPRPERFLILFPKGWTLEKTGSRGAWDFVRQKYPAIAKYIEPFKTKAEKRYDKGDFWWELRACDYYSEFEKPKIIFPDISTRGNFTLDHSRSYTVNTSYIIPVEDYVLLSILNSKLTTFYYSNITSSIRGNYLRFIYQYLTTIPIVQLKDKSRHDRMVELVERMLELHKRLNEAQTEHEQTALKRQIDATDKQIDQLVYELYGLTDEEIKIVEGN